MLRHTHLLQFTSWALAATMGLSPSLQAATCKISTTANPTVYTTIQSAIEVSQCTTIKVPDGVFKENLIINRSLNLIGNGPNSTIVDGGQKARVVTINSGTVSLQGLAIQNGIAKYGGGGGGILNQGTLTVQQCSITGNQADPNTGSGGGINNTGSLQVLNTLLSGNMSATSGGGIFTEGVNVLVQNSSIMNNSSGSGAGGGIYVSSGQMILDGSFVSGNTAHAGGGIFQNNVSTVTLRNHSLISGNNAVTGGGNAHITGTTLTNDPTSRVINNRPDDVVQY